MGLGIFFMGDAGLPRRGRLLLVVGRLRGWRSAFGAAPPRCWSRLEPSAARRGGGAVHWILLLALTGRAARWRSPTGCLGPSPHQLPPGAVVGDGASAAFAAILAAAPRPPFRHSS